MQKSDSQHGATRQRSERPSYVTRFNLAPWILLYPKFAQEEKAEFESCISPLPPRDRSSLKTSLCTHQEILQAENNDEEDQELFVASCIFVREETHSVSFDGNLF